MPSHLAQALKRQAWLNYQKESRFEVEHWNSQRTV